jgi:hypothetical protein
MTPKVIPVSYAPLMIMAKRQGKKTQTRRVITGLKKWVTDVEYSASGWGTKAVKPHWLFTDEFSLMADSRNPRYGRLGDIHLVRENYHISSWIRGKNNFNIILRGNYSADGAEFEVELATLESIKFYEWQRQEGNVPAIHMFNSLCRMRDRVVEVRAHRIQEIQDADILAEGIDCCEALHTFPDNRAKFTALWDSINARRGFPFASNPFVWAITTSPVNY